MKAVIFNSLQEAETFANSIDSTLGYPKNGTDNNGGLHVSAEDAITESASYILKHPTLDEWAYIVEGEAMTSAIPGGNVIEDLTSDWFPAQP